MSVALLATPSSAHATFPGKNGELTVDLGDLYRMGTSGKKPQRIGDGAQPAWSASGRTLLYRSWQGRSAHPSVPTAIVAWPDASPESQPQYLTDPSQELIDEQPSPAPDGTRFAFEADARLYVSALPAGGEYAQPVSLQRPGSCPAWSPNGKAIAYAYETSKAGTEIRQVTPTGGSLPRIFRSALRLGCPTWSPDGKLIAFSDNVDPDRERILVVTRSGKVKYRLKANTYRHPGVGEGAQGDPLGVTFSPDGRYLVYSGNEYGTHIFNLKSGKRRRLCRCGGEIDWRPLPVSGK